MASRLTCTILRTFPPVINPSRLSLPASLSVRLPLLGLNPKMTGEVSCRSRSWSKEARL
jgi:hypothetical protein